MFAAVGIDNRTYDNKSKASSKNVARTGLNTTARSRLITNSVEAAASEAVDISTATHKSTGLNLNSIKIDAKGLELKLLKFDKTTTNRPYLTMSAIEKTVTNVAAARLARSRSLVNLSMHHSDVS